MLRRLVPHMQLSEETQCRGGRSSSISCFTCRATAFYSAFPEAPHHQAVISVLTIPYYSKIGGGGGFLCCASRVSALSPLAAVQGLPRAQRVLAPGPGRPALPRASAATRSSSRTRHQGKARTAAAVTHQHTIWGLTQGHKNELCLNITPYSQLNRAVQEEITSPTIYPHAAAARRHSEGTIKSLKGIRQNETFFLWCHSNPD